MSLILDALRRARSGQPPAADVPSRAGSPLGLAGPPDGQIPAGLHVGRLERMPSRRRPVRWRTLPLLAIIGLGVVAVFQLSMDIQPRLPAGQPGAAPATSSTQPDASQASGAAAVASEEASLRQAAADALEELARKSAIEETAGQDLPPTPWAAGAGDARGVRGAGASSAPSPSALVARPESRQPPVRERPEPAVPGPEAPPPASRAPDARVRPVRPRTAVAPPSVPTAPAAAEAAWKPPLPSRPAAAQASTAAATPSSATVDHFTLAKQYHNLGDFEQAVRHYLALLDREPLNAEVRNNLGMLYLDRGFLKEATEQFDRAVRINPQYIAARVNLGVALLNTGRLAEARVQLRAALDSDPRNVGILVNLALVQKADGHPEQALETLVRAIGIDPTHAYAHYNLAVLYDERSDLAKAYEHYTAFLKYAGPEHGSTLSEVERRVKALEAKLERTR